MARDVKYWQLAHFYKQVALLIKKEKMHRVSLSQLEATFKKNKERVFSWMQWSDAKLWFGYDTCDAGICYYLKPHLENASFQEINETINKYYDIYQYDE